MVWAMWLFGSATFFLWGLTLWIVIDPPGDNVNARGLGEILAVIPFFAGAATAVVWVILALIHWA